MKKAFIYRRGGLGDTLLVFPIFEILTRQGYHITASGNRDYLEIARQAGWVQRITSEEPDDDFDLRVIIGVNGNLYPFPEKREWIVEYYLCSLGLSGYTYSKVLPLNIEPQRLARVLIAPSSGSKKKNLPPELFMRLRELFPEGVFLAGEADLWLTQYLKPIMLDHDILKGASIIKGASLFIGADSGLSHLSAYLGVKTVIIYGPSDPVVWRPIGERVIQLRATECKPCFPSVCEGRDCLQKSDIIEQVLSALKALSTSDTLPDLSYTLCNQGS